MTKEAGRKALKVFFITTAAAMVLGWMALTLYGALFATWELKSSRDPITDYPKAELVLWSDDIDDAPGEANSAYDHWGLVFLCDGKSRNTAIRNDVTSGDYKLRFDRGKPFDVHFGSSPLDEPASEPATLSPAAEAIFTGARSAHKLVLRHIADDGQTKDVYFDLTGNRKMFESFDEACA